MLAKTQVGFLNAAEPDRARILTAVTRIDGDDHVAPAVHRRTGRPLDDRRRPGRCEIDDQTMPVAFVGLEQEALGVEPLADGWVPVRIPVTNPRPAGGPAVRASVVSLRSMTTREGLSRLKMRCAVGEDRSSTTRVDSGPDHNLSPSTSCAAAMPESHPSTMRAVRTRPNPGITACLSHRRAALCLQHPGQIAILLFENYVISS